MHRWLVSHCTESAIWSTKSLAKCEDQRDITQSTGVDVVSEMKQARMVGGNDSSFFDCGV